MSSEASARRPEEETILGSDLRRDPLSVYVVSVSPQPRDPSRVDREGGVEPAREGALVAGRCVVTARHRRDARATFDDPVEHRVGESPARMNGDHEIGSADHDVLEGALRDDHASGDPGPGDSTTWLGSHASAAVRSMASLRSTRTSAPCAARSCVRFQVKES